MSRRGATVADERYIVVINQGLAQRSLRKGLATAVPFNKVISGLKKVFVS
jgi:hypothetical protein